jgi:regulator of replication initiation timing
MRVALRVSGGETRDLGLQSSPFTLHAEDFPREGGYAVDLRAPTFPNWINASRDFQIQAGDTPPTPGVEPEVEGDGDPTIQLKDFLRALKASRTSRDRAHQRAKFLTEEVATLRAENERVSKQLEKVYQTEEQDGERSTELERQLTQLSEQLRGLADENGALRMRLSTVIPCTVWGYYSYPHPNTIPVTRKVLLVSDLAGQIFRNQVECEAARRSDASAGSPCLCVGSAWTG